MEKIKVGVSFSDERGKIIDLIESDSINAITIVTFKKGAVRGNHYHKQTIQWNYLMSGKIRLVTQVPGEAVTETIMEPGDFTVTRENDRHALQALEDSEVMVFTKGPRGGKEYETDTFRLDQPLLPSAK
jgi:quercetin dioxygenase-like cupin family protein